MQPVLHWKLAPAFRSEVNAYLLIHICSGSYLLFLTGSCQVNTWENISLFFSEEEFKCITHGKVHVSQQA